MSSGLLEGVESVGSISNMGGEATPGREDAVPVAFDEAVLRALCDMDVSVWTGLKGWELITVRSTSTGR